jgi:hypothetical protein
MIRYQSLEYELCSTDESEKDNADRNKCDKEENIAESPKNHTQH